MSIYTWLSDSEFELYTKVSDKVLNEVFQEVREVMPDVFISERTVVERRIFRKNKMKTFYSIYTISKKPEVRCLNLNTSNSDYVFNYLCGLLNGFNCKLEVSKKLN